MNTPNLMDKINELVSKVEYFFAKRWLDKTFGKQEYWVDYIQELITNEEMTTKQKFYSYIEELCAYAIAGCEVSDKKADEFWEWFKSENVRKILEEEKNTGTGAYDVTTRAGKKRFREMLRELVKLY